MKENNKSFVPKTPQLILAIQACLLACLMLMFSDAKLIASGSLYFNGNTNNYMMLQGQLPLSSSSDSEFTVEFWINPQSLNEGGNVLREEVGNDIFSAQSFVDISIQKSGEIGLSSFTDRGDLPSIQVNIASPSNVITMGQWQHIAIVGYPIYDVYVAGQEYMAANQYLIYLNGTLISSNSALWNYTEKNIYWDLGETYNGFEYSGGTIITSLGRSPIACEIGEFRGWNRALSQTEIQSKMGQVLNPTDETGLAIYWRFTEGTGNTVHDLVGTNNGTLMGAAWSSDLPNITLQPPVIVQQPTNQLVSLHGTNALFTIGLTGSPPLLYQWLLNGTNIPGATSASIAITNATLQDLGSYSVIVTNMLGSAVSSNATLSMYPYLAAPYGGTTILWGQNANLSVSPAGTGPFSYQWYKNGVAINGATNQTYSIPAIQFTNAGFYSVVVTSFYGSVTNTPAQVVVNPAGVTIGMYPGVTINGTIGYTYSIQSAPSLSDTNGWITNTNVTLQATQQLWFDPSINAYNPANPQRFYRVVPGQ